MTDKRIAARERTRIMGSIAFDRGRQSVDCAVRDLSVSGARLGFVLPVDLPDEIDLHVPAKGRVYRAAIRWRRGRQAGVEFRSSIAAAEQVEFAPAS